MGLSVHIAHIGIDVTITLDGILDENCQLPEFSEVIQGKMTIHLGRLNMINSLGCRKWAIWLRDKVKAKGGITLSECSPAIVNQLSILEGFVPKSAKVASFFVPYFCEKCSHEERVLFRFGVDYSTHQPPNPSDHLECPKCHAQMELEVVQEKYLRYFLVA